MAAIGGLVVLNSLMDAVLPVLVSVGLDRITDGDGVDRDAWLLVAGILVAGALSWGFNYVRQSRSAEVVGDVVLGLRRDAIRAVMARDMSFFDEFSSGKIVSRVTSDTADFSNTVTLTLSLVSQVLLVVIITGALLTRDAMLTLIVLGLAPVIVAIALAFRHYARRVTTAAQRARGELNGTVQETMRGIAVARASARRGRSTTSSRTSTAERTGSRCGRATSSAGSSRSCSWWLGWGRRSWCGSAATGSGAATSRRGTGTCSSRRSRCSGSR
jgi:ABC-type multidrug transport system fused ATPase/permease subunit